MYALFNIKFSVYEEAHYHQEKNWCKVSFQNVESVGVEKWCWKLAKEGDDIEQQNQVK